MPLALTTFWEWFFLLLIWVPLVALWVTALIDIIGHPDLNGLAKALWVLCIFLVPFIGVLVYLIFASAHRSDRRPRYAG
jgi:hypothetical protein